MVLSVGQQFEIERLSMAIDTTADPKALKTIAKQLLQAWQTLRAATYWVIRPAAGHQAHPLKRSSTCLARCIDQW